MTKQTSDSRTNAIAALQEFDSLSERIDATDKLRGDLERKIARVQFDLDPSDGKACLAFLVLKGQLAACQPAVDRLKGMRNKIHSELGAHFDSEQKRVAILAEAVLSRVLAESTQRMANAFPDSDRAECHRLATESPDYRRAHRQLRLVRSAVFGDHARGCKWLHEQEAELQPAPGTAVEAAAAA